MRPYPHWQHTVRNLTWSEQKSPEGVWKKAVEGFRRASRDGEGNVWCGKCTARYGRIRVSLTTEQQLRDKLRKIAALFEGATTAGERNAAAAAIERIKRSIDTTAKVDLPVEYTFTLPDDWKRRLFSALCRRYGLQPYRYRRQRYTTVMVRVPKSFVDKTLWPEYLELSDALNEYLEEATERIIREEIYRDAEEAPERDGH